MKFAVSLLLAVSVVAALAGGRRQQEVANIVGVYYLEQKIAGGEQLWVLSITGAGRSALTCQSTKNLKKVDTYLGKWSLGNFSQFKIDVSGVGGRIQLTVKALNKPMRLEATTYDKARWGKAIPSFRRGTPPTLKAAKG